MKSGQEVVVDGKIAEFVEKKGGWITIIDHEGKTRKVRASKVTEVTAKVAGKPRRQREEGDEEDDAVRLYPNMENYVKGLGSTPSGRDTIDINDDVANQLRGMNFENAAKAVAKAVTALGEKTSYEELMTKYEHLNPGMQRMNLGNKLRGAMKRAGEQA
jgi:hypothetical protein